jgi:hypothetical protein
MESEDRRADCSLAAAEFVTFVASVCVANPKSDFICWKNRASQIRKVC